MSNTRIERDSMGELQVPAEALYGAQTQRAVNNFPISHQRMPAQFIRALILAKAAAAKVNVDLKQISEGQGKAIVDAAQGLLEGDYMRHFPVDIFQTGSGTSSNMNANEVIATLASRLLGVFGVYQHVHGDFFAQLGEGAAHLKIAQMSTHQHLSTLSA